MELFKKFQIILILIENEHVNKVLIKDISRRSVFTILSIATFFLQVSKVSVLSYSSASNGVKDFMILIGMELINPYDVSR